MDAIEVSKYILANAYLHGDLLTNRKLVKILYYVKAWGLVYFDDGIIPDDFEGWIHGPVCVRVYEYYKHFRYDPICLHEIENASQYIRDFKKSHPDDARRIELIDEVYKKYIPLTGFQLELLSHSETPWQESRKGLDSMQAGHNVIDEATMRKFYTRMYDEANS